MVAYVLYMALTVLSWILLLYVLMSLLEWAHQMWPRSVPAIPHYNPIVRFIDGMGYTLLHPIRKVIDPYQRGTGFDFSPIVAFLVIDILRSWVARLPF